MARGWESKSVEEQQSQFTRFTDGTKPGSSREDQQKKEHIKTLELHRARVVQQMSLSQSPRYTELLQRELDHLDRELVKLRR